MLKIADFKGLESLYLIQGLANIMHLARQHPDHVDRFRDGVLIDDADAPQVISDTLNYYTFALDMYTATLHFVLDQHGMKMSARDISTIDWGDLLDIAKAVYIAVYYTPMVPMRLTATLRETYRALDPETASMGALLLRSQLERTEG